MVIAGIRAGKSQQMECGSIRYTHSSCRLVVRHPTHVLEASVCVEGPGGWGGVRVRGRWEGGGGGGGGGGIHMYNRV